MKLISLFATVLFAVPALADHAVDNASAIARSAYQLADAAEALEHDARGELGGHIHGGAVDNLAVADRDGGITIQDHREDNLRGLSTVARRLHLSASHLYRTANRISGGWNYPNGGNDDHVTPQDHRGDQLRDSYARVSSDFRTLNRYWQQLQRYRLSHQIQRDYRWIQREMNSLNYSVYGRRGGF